MAPAAGARAWPQPFRGAVRSFSTTTRAVDGVKSEADAEMAEFSSRRRERLAELQAGEEGLYKETFPRLEHRTETMSVSDFLAAHSEAETPEKDVPEKEPEEVTLYGMPPALYHVHDMKLNCRLFTGRIRSLRRHGKYLVFIDIVNQFHTIQAMVNWSKVSKGSLITKHQYRLFARMLERGDHICMSHLVPPYERRCGRAFTRNRRANIEQPLRGGRRAPAPAS